MSLVPLALDALKSSPSAVTWFPCPPVARHPGYASQNDVDDTDSSDDELPKAPAADEATTAWAGPTAKTPDGACVCCIRHEDLCFALVVSAHVEPTLPFALLNALIALLQEYLGTVSEATISDTFDMVLQIFEEAFAAPQPMLTDASTLKELIPPPSLYTKMLNAATAALSPATNPVLAGAEGRSTLSSPIPWRRNGIKYTTQEIYFDVREEIGGIIDKYGKIIVAEVRGTIKSRCRLSGMPDLLMNLSSPDLLQDCCFHPCVRLNKWANGKALSFVPPDGAFTLMEYQLTPPTIPGIVPLQVKPIVTTGQQGGAFHLTIASRSVPSLPLENLKLVFDLGKHAHQVQATISGGRSINKRPSREEGGAPGGRWEFVPGEGTLVWQAPKLSSSDQPIVFQGTWSSTCVSFIELGAELMAEARVSPCPNPALAIQASFEQPLTNISGLQISSLKIASNGPESTKPYKGVRPMLQAGRLEFRWS